MEKILYILIFLCSNFVFGQTTYKSPFTQFLSSGGEVESFERLISVFPSEIRITSTTKEGGKVIQVLVIKDIIDSPTGYEYPIRTYYCKSRDEKSLYQVSIPMIDSVEQILLTHLNLSTREAHDLRFLIDSQKTFPIKKVQYF